MHRGGGNRSRNKWAAAVWFLAEKTLVVLGTRGCAQGAKVWHTRLVVEERRARCRGAWRGREQGNRQRRLTARNRRAALAAALGRARLVVAHRRREAREVGGWGKPRRPMERQGATALQGVMGGGRAGGKHEAEWGDDGLCSAPGGGAAREAGTGMGVEARVRCRGFC
jgi:hypothetical protein